MRKSGTPAKNDADGRAAAITFARIKAPNGLRTFSRVYENLLASDLSGRSRIILCCGASDGEGVTTVISGLAIAAAEGQIGQILLIDGNFRKPRICNLFGVSGGGGMSELLSGANMDTVSPRVWEVQSPSPEGLVYGRIDHGALLCKTSIPNLWIMGAGRVVENHLQMLEPPKFYKCLQELLEVYSFIFIDGPAVNVYPESILYASQVDRTLLVVRANVTRRPVVQKAVSKLSEVGCKKIDVILNRRVFAIPQFVYKLL